MKKIILLIFITFTFFQNIYSQTDFRKGYIISNENDTIIGLINYREGSKKHKICDFKSTEYQNTISYTPNQIKGYRYLNDKYFISKEITKDDNSKEKIFFEVLVKGKITLYKYKGSYFVEKNGENYNELINKPLIINQDGKEYFKYSNRHIAVLSYLLSDCNSLKGKINLTIFDERELTILIENYNNCIDEPSISFKEKKTWFKTHFGLSLGINSSKINLASDRQGLEHLETDLNRSNSIMPGFYFDFLSPRIHERISFHTGVFYLTSNFESFSIIESGYDTYRNHVTIELKQLKIPLGFRYTFPKRNFTPYFNLGVSNTINLKSSSLWRLERERNNIVETYESEAFDMAKSQIGFWGGIGVKKSITNEMAGFLEVRYEQTSGVAKHNPNSYSQNNIINFQFLIGISY